MTPYQNQLLGSTITPVKTNGIFHLFTYNKVRLVHYINGVFSSLTIVFALANSADTGEMHPFYLGLCFLSKYLFKVF